MHVYFSGVYKQYLSKSRVQSSVHRSVQRCIPRCTYVVQKCAADQRCIPRCTHVVHMLYKIARHTKDL